MLYRIHRIKQTPGENFRWAAHTGGLAIVKAKDYEGGAEEIEAGTPYAAWKMLGEENRALRPGDVLEIMGSEPGPGELQIAKYIGFEPAKWYVPESAANTGSTPTESAAPAIPSTPAHPIQSYADKRLDDPERHA
jgi:hypothetical protein